MQVSCWGLCIEKGCLHIIDALKENESEEIVCLDRKAGSGQVLGMEDWWPIDLMAWSHGLCHCSPANGLPNHSQSQRTHSFSCSSPGSSSQNSDSRNSKKPQEIEFSFTVAFLVAAAFSSNFGGLG